MRLEDKRYKTVFRLPTHQKVTPRKSTVSQGRERERLRSEERRAPDPACTAALEHAATLCHRRAAGPDVVDEEDSGWDGRIRSNEERAADVLFPLLCLFSDGVSDS